MGFEAGIDHKFNDAPIFYWLYTGMIAVGAAVILIPHAPLENPRLSQVGNGVWLPVVLIFMLLLVNRRDLMGDYVNTRTFNVVAWITAYRRDSFSRLSWSTSTSSTPCRAWRSEREALAVAFER